MHVDVVVSAEDGLTATDAAVDQEAQTIALRFQDAGVYEVVGVGGTGAVTWPRALQDNQSTYKPPWIATNVTALASYIASAKGKNPYLDNVMTSTPRRPPPRRGRIRRCKSAFPSCARGTHQMPLPRPLPKQSQAASSG